ncbi:hypothetical protein llap_12598 [Limosa lapponica baueri]|uniref:Uncharacterized protein n=1 Tax=Limosa lapponica baueri TaxID=1758121 RepID=A0A2I0TTH2_LIMLA|nr:hypothetical protein llap_12598 [Limosa lapponica baueri]
MHLGLNAPVPGVSSFLSKRQHGAQERAKDGPQNSEGANTSAQSLTAKLSFRLRKAAARRELSSTCWRTKGDHDNCRNVVDPERQRTWKIWRNLLVGEPFRFLPS